MRSFTRSASMVLIVLALFGCTQNPAENQGIRTPPPAASSPGAVSPTPTATAPLLHPVSLHALMQKEYTGRKLTLGRVLGETASYTRYFVTYKSGSLTISGILNVPKGNGPFPALVLNHGYIDPDVYVNGQGLRREQDYLAREGYIVLHTDYRNHAASDDDPNFELGLRLGYTEDVLNAVMALKRSTLETIDKDRIGLVGRSMGGGVTLNAAVVRPDLIDAVVVFAPVSSNAVDNFNRWFRRGGDRRELAERIADTYGSPEENPAFWRNVSSVSFFDRIAVPIVIHHGTSDDSVPIAWSEKTTAALEAAGKDVRFFAYQDEEHAFGPLWTRSMRRTVAYLDALMKG